MVIVLERVDVTSTGPSTPSSTPDLVQGRPHAPPPS